MIDPMANLDAAPGAGPETDAAGGADGSQEVFDMHAYRSNLMKMDNIRSFMGIVSGCVAGVCGLTGLAGLGELCFDGVCLYGGGCHVRCAPFALLPVF